MHKNLISNFKEHYLLLDSASGRKCEQIHTLKVERHSPQAIWNHKMHPKKWHDFDATCIRKKDGGGQWQFNKKTPEKIPFSWQADDKTSFNFELKLTSFGHCGIFFEQAVLWNLMQHLFSQQKKQHSEPLTFLNLFGYTGAASIIAAKSGVTTTHIDSAKGVLTWGKSNAELNHIPEGKIKWIHEDALVYVKNAIKRNLKFDGILADPPSWGHGVKNEVWNFEEHMSELISGIQKILKPQKSFFLLTSHTHGVQAHALENIMKECFPENMIQFGDLGIKHFLDDRVLPAGVYALSTNQLSV